MGNIRKNRNIREIGTIDDMGKIGQTGTRMIDKHRSIRNIRNN